MTWILSTVTKNKDIITHEIKLIIKMLNLKRFCVYLENILKSSEKNIWELYYKLDLLFVFSCYMQKNISVNSDNRSNWNKLIKTRIAFLNCVHLKM
jgi:hypothetical protein